MKYIGMPSAMWLLFKKSFEQNLSTVFGISKTKSAEIMKTAKTKYKRIIDNLPTFEKGDRFKMNIVNCAMLTAVILSMHERPEVEKLTIYYRNSMMTGVMKYFCRMSGKKKFTPKDIESMQKTAAFRAADRNPYSWNMQFIPYSDGSGYEARFTKCGICTLMKELNLSEYIPVMCKLDYAMSEAGGASEFLREHTLALGGDYCDCGYKRKGR